MKYKIMSWKTLERLIKVMEKLTEENEEHEAIVADEYNKIMSEEE